VPLTAGGAVDQPLLLALEVMELRAYAQTWQALKRAGSDAEKPTGPLAKLAAEIAGDIMLEEMQARKAAGKMIQTPR
jgi:hypothetical protein